MLLLKLSASSVLTFALSCNMKYYLSILMLLASLTITSGLRAQYRWHVVLSDRVDTMFYRGITSISCNGENCIATEVIYAPGVGDSNVILCSHDGGLSWSPVAAGIPQWMYTGGKQGLYYDASQQIDSLNAVVADVHGFVLTTHDGWKTWRVDSSEKGNIYSVNFANVSEGMMQAPFGFYWTTVDSGNDWRGEVFDNGVATYSYGNSMFRLFNSPNEIFTTHNNWNSWDTTYIASNGPLADTSFHSYAFFFGSGDTLTIEGWRWKDSTDFHASLAMALSTDFGAHWNELSVPRNNGIYFGAYAIQLSLDWKHMVMAGNDSVGRIVQSFDGGAHWECDTVPLSSGIPYHNVMPFAVTGSGRLLAGIVDDSGFLGSSSLVFLEPVPSSVRAPVISQEAFTIFPNPATSEIQISSIAGNISILDPLGRSYEVPVLSGEDARPTRLDVSSLPWGVYFISDGTSRTKFVKE
jgi:photosystem II stability/assembly factor-like uncharacterized protein